MVHFEIAEVAMVLVKMVEVTMVQVNMFENEKSTRAVHQKVQLQCHFEVQPTPTLLWIGGIYRGQAKSFMPGMEGGQRSPCPQYRIIDCTVGLSENVKMKILRLVTFFLL